MKRTAIALSAVAAGAAITLAGAGPVLAGPTATAALKSCTASVSNRHPADFKTVNRAYFRVAGSDGRATVRYYVSGATPGRRVVVDVTVVRGHQANSCQTSFPPK